MRPLDHQVIDLYYTAARTEIIERMKLRDHALVLYVTGVSATIGVAFGQSSRFELILLLPFISFVAALIANHHSEATGALGFYCARELSTFLPRDIPQWDNSYTLQEFRTGAIRYRLLGESILLLAPSILALGYVAKMHGVRNLVEPSVVSLAWWMGAAFAIAVCTLQVLTLRARGRYYKRTWTGDA